MSSDASTPLMRQYNSIKQQVPNALLMFRLGDFYELFFEDAVVAVQRIEELDRVKVRAEFERRFTAERMAHDYVDIYRKLIAAQPMLNGRHSTWQAIRLSRLSEPADSDDQVQLINTSSAVLSSANVAES